MQFQTIITSLALAIMATAAPAPAPVPNGGWGQPGQAAQNKCTQNQTATCCNSVGGLIGLNCVVLNLIALIDTQCAPQQTLACCSNSGIENGLVVVGDVCAPITL